VLEQDRSPELAEAYERAIKVYRAARLWVYDQYPQGLPDLDQRGTIWGVH